MAIAVYLIIGLVLAGFGTEQIIKNDPDAEKDVGTWWWYLAMVVYACIWPVSVIKALITIFGKDT